MHKHAYVCTVYSIYVCKQYKYSLSTNPTCTETHTVCGTQAKTYLPVTGKTSACIGQACMHGPLS